MRLTHGEVAPAQLATSLRFMFMGVANERGRTFTDVWSCSLLLDHILTAGRKSAPSPAIAMSDSCRVSLRPTDGFETRKIVNKPNIVFHFSMFVCFDRE